MNLTEATNKITNGGLGANKHGILACNSFNDIWAIDGDFNVNPNLNSQTIGMMTVFTVSGTHYMAFLSGTNNIEQGNISSNNNITNVPVSSQFKIKWF